MKQRFARVVNPVPRDYVPKYCRTRGCSETFAHEGDHTNRRVATACPTKHCYKAAGHDEGEHAERDPRQPSVPRRYRRSSKSFDATRRAPKVLHIGTPLARRVGKQRMEAKS